MVSRTRFAPSPTGYLHVGGARTALYCWLYAKNTQGKYILRIEDTDRERSTQEATDAILESLSWLGLAADEGPFYQTKRFSRYDEVAKELINRGLAYKCYCSKDRLGKLRLQQMADGKKPRYDRHCRDKDISSEEPFVVRFKNPLEGDVVFNDLIRGEVKINNAELDDLIIVRSDGTPTYNFTVSVDDSDMEVSLVIRGADHITNTPRQINILQALGKEIPQYAHVPLIMGKDGKRLSKRHGAVSVLQYRDDGYLPQALLNYLVRLGWSHQDQEIFSRKEMQELFKVEAVHKAAAIFDGTKLEWLNQHYMKTLPPEEVEPHLVWQMQDLQIATDNGPLLQGVIVALRERVKTLREMAEKSRYFYEDFASYPENLVAKIFKPESREILQQLKVKLAAQELWNKEELHQIVADVSESTGMKLGKVAGPLRLAVMGTNVSPPIDMTLELLGKDKTLSRLDKALAIIPQMA